MALSCMTTCLSRIAFLALVHSSRTFAVLRSPLYARRGSRLVAAATTGAENPDGEMEAARLSLREHLEQRRMREALSTLQTMSRNGPVDVDSYDDTLEVLMGVAPVPHKLVHRLGQLRCASPAPAAPDVRSAEAFTIAAAEVGDWRAALTWWASASAVEASTACKEAAALALVRLGNVSQAEALLVRITAPSARGLRRIISACARASDGPAAGLARNAFERAAIQHVADSSMLHDALAASSRAGQHGAGLGLMNSPAVVALADEVRGAVPVLRVVALLHASAGNPDAAIATLRRVRAATGAQSGGGGGGGGSGVCARSLGLQPIEMEALVRSCARSGRWRHVRWLLRATAREMPVPHSRCSIELALAACVQWGGAGHEAPSAERPLRNARRLAIAAIGARCAARVEQSSPQTMASAAAAVLPNAAEPLMAQAAVRAPALWARLNGLLCAPAARPTATTDGAFVTSPSAADEAVVRGAGGDDGGASLCAATETVALLRRYTSASATEGDTADGVAANGVAANGVTANGVAANGITADGEPVKVYTASPASVELVLRAAARHPILHTDVRRRKDRSPFPLCPLTSPDPPPLTPPSTVTTNERKHPPPRTHG